MKQPTAPNLYPELPIEDGQNYRLQKISEIERTLINERDMRKSLYKKYKRCINITDGVDTGLISASVILAGVGITVPIMLPLEIAAIVCGCMGVCVKLVRRKLMSKTQKHCNVQTKAESKLNSIKDIVSKALQDGEISEGEFKMVLNEMEKYSELKQEIKTTKNIEITDEEKKKLIEQGRMEAMNTIQKSLKPV